MTKRPSMQNRTPAPPAEVGKDTLFDAGIPGVSRQDGSTPRQHDGSAAPVRRKFTLYLDDPRHVDLMDELLTALRKYDLPRDNSMLVRALLEMAAPALHDPAHLEALAAACQQTLPHR